MYKLSLDFLQSELNRQVEFIRFSDVKIAFIFTLVSGLSGFWLASIDFILNTFCVYWPLYFLTSLLFILFYSFIIFGIFPRFGNKTASLFFFGSIAQMRLADFLKRYNEISYLEIRNQILEQVHINSFIASKKMRCVQNASICFLFLVLLSGLFALLK